ncbi:hypothetical protein ABZS96_33860 [Streptomyces avermitilis]|uniref:hypothetical protein n=1 Tax=Streptomyces avermitilis TaxID=33903 RepID=UPI0033A24468
MNTRVTSGTPGARRTTAARTRRTWMSPVHFFHHSTVICPVAVTGGSAAAASLKNSRSVRALVR